MLTIDTDFVIHQLNQIAAQLKETFAQIEPAISLDQMFQAFKKIDGQAAATLQAALAKAYPHIGWLDGELEDADAWAQVSQDDYWICDALDGAIQYVRGIPSWCTTLTLLSEGRPVFAVIIDAMNGEIFHATEGGGAFLNGKPIRVNQCVSHHEGMVATSQPPFISRMPAEILQAANSLARVLPEVMAVRNLGPTSLQLAYVACGRLDAFWEFGEDGFNCAGAALLVREAGGTSSDAGGQPYSPQSASLLAATPGAHVSMLATLAGI